MRRLASALLFLAGSTVAIFITGRHDVAAMVAATTGAALGMTVGYPCARLGRWAVILSLLFAAATAAAFLPAPDLLPAWRAGAPAVVQLASSWAAMPGHLLFWWLTLVGTILAAWFLLASPLDARMLRFFLHVVAVVIASYAVLSIVQAQTSWIYPFAGKANFGLLPNRNHTATLLVVGSIVSFGLMQWEVARGYRGPAVVAALCGAPALAALLFFSTSRAGVVFLALGLVLWAAGAAGTAMKRGTVLGAAGVLVGFLLLLFIVGGGVVQDRLSALWHEMLAVGDGGEAVAEVDFRQPVFRDTIFMIADAPLTGQGMGHFEFVFPHYREASRTTSLVLHPESDWLMVAAESGWPAMVVLVLLGGWYLVRSWRARRDDDGLLRWTVASAIGATMAHGMIDVPWHRPALGWFLLVVALAALPGTGHPLSFPRLWRSVQIVVGVALLAAAGYLGWSGSTERPPLPYRWESYHAEMIQLAEVQKFDDGEFVAREALRDFPLQYQGYYWRATFLRIFEGTDKEMEADMAGGRFAEPVLPKVAAEQAQVWAGIDDDREAEARAEAIRRAALLDARTGSGGSALAELEAAIRAARERPGVQKALRDRISDDPRLVAQWVSYADPRLADTYLQGLGDGAMVLLDGLPPDARQVMLDRWITLPSSAGAVAYMETRKASVPGAYARTLAKYFAKSGDKARAVGIVAQAEGISLEERAVGGEFGQQLSGLEAQGNEVAVRRLLKEAVEAKAPEAERLATAMNWYGTAGDWEMAWRAASRLVSTRKNGQ